MTVLKLVGWTEDEYDDGEKVCAVAFFLLLVFVLFRPSVLFVGYLPLSVFSLSSSVCLSVCLSVARL